MKKILIFCFCVLITIGCKQKAPKITQEKETVSTNEISSSQTPTNQTLTSDPLAPTNQKIPPMTQAKAYNHTSKKLPTSHNCKTKGLSMEDNQLWVAEEHLWLCIEADEKTHDSDFGDSYRILAVYDTENCKEIDRQTLPVNRSPDFPWYLYPATYNIENKVVGIQGYDFVYLYDVANKTLLPRQKPQFLTTRKALDAQSGMPYGLAINGQYIFGYAMDAGAYAFDLTDKKNVKALLPVSEYRNKENNDLIAVFITTNNDNTNQVIIPTLNPEDGSLTLNKMLKQPIKLDIGSVKKLNNGKTHFIYSKDKNNIVAIDFTARKVVVLPKSLVSKSEKQLLSFVKKGGGIKF